MTILSLAKKRQNESKYCTECAARGCHPAPARPGPYPWLAFFFGTNAGGPRSLHWGLRLWEWGKRLLFSIFRLMLSFLPNICDSRRLRETCANATFWFLWMCCCWFFLHKNRQQTYGCCEYLLVRRSYLMQVIHNTSATCCYRCFTVNAWCSRWSGVSEKHQQKISGMNGLSYATTEKLQTML